MSKKMFRNTAITTMAATATVAAVAPAVSADEVEFPDVTQDNVHYDSVMALAQQGAIDGDLDGNFNPFKDVKRAQTAAMLADALGLEADNPEKTLEQYNDVDASDDHAKAIAALTEEGIFSGDQDNNFNSWSEINREQMAKVLVEAFNLDEYDNDEDVELNKDVISSEFTGYVQTLANLGITEEASNYDSWTNVNRDTFSSFVVRSQAFVQSVEDVEVTDNEDGTLTVTGVAPDAVSNGAHVVVKDSEGEVVANNEELALDEDGAFEFTTGELEEGKYSVTAMGMFNDQHGEANAVTKEDVEVTVTPAVESVSAINASEVTVNFNKAIEDITEDDLEVVDTETGANQYVNTLSVAADNESVTVDFYDDLESESTYEFNFNIDGETVTYEYDFELGTVQQIEIEDQTVKAAGELDDKEDASVLEYKLFDANGVDLTEESSDNVTFESPSAAVNEDGTVDSLEAGTSTTAKVVYTDENNQKVESDEITVTAEASQPVELSNWTVADTDSFTGFSNDDYEQDTEAYSDNTADYLNVELKDQFGDVSSDNVTFESLDESVAVVDKTSGEIQAFETGSLPVKVSVVEDDEEVFSQTVEVDVKAKKEASDIELEQNSVTLSTQDDVGVDIEATVLDQYGNEFDEVIDVNTDSDLNPTYTDSGNINVEAGSAEEGTYTVELTAGDDVVEELTVVVEEPGEFAEYEVRGIEDTFDLNSDNQSTDLSVVAVDADGLYIEEETENISVTVEDEDGTDVTEDTPSAVEGTTINAGVLSTGDYTLEVTLDKKVIETAEFSVVDTTEQPEVSFTSSNLEGTSNSDVLPEIDGIVEISEDNAELNSVSFVSADDSIVSDENNTFVSAGETSIYVESFEIDPDTTNGNTDDVVEVELDNPEKINVVVE